MNGWQVIDGKTYYYENDKPIKGFNKIEGVTYYFKETGEMAQGWLTVNEKIYYFAEKSAEKPGKMAQGKQSINSAVYYFNSDGTINTGFVGDAKGDIRYYHYSKILKGWYKIGEGTYYFDDAGVMATGERTIGGKKYTFTKTGTLVGTYSDAIDLNTNHSGNGFDIGNGDWSDITIF